jgi:hypothetical protein
MPLSKIKPEYATTVIAFNRGGGRPLGLRDDIDKLAIIAHESGDKSIINLFAYLPPLDQLKKAKVDAELKKVPEPPKTEAEK